MSRDDVAQRLANLALRIATPYYRAFVAGAIEYGMRAAARDQNAGIPAPSDWRTMKGAVHRETSTT